MEQTLATRPPGESALATEHICPVGKYSQWGWPPRDEPATGKLQLKRAHLVDGLPPVSRLWYNELARGGGASIQMETSSILGIDDEVGLREGCRRALTLYG